MKRYVKGVLGGLLAILAAFGWCIALIVIISWMSKDSIVGIHVANYRGVWIVPFLIFAIGFYLAFRSAYSSTSK